MHDERLAATEIATPAKPTPAVDRNRHSKRIGFGLLGLLGAAWMAVIAARYAELMPG